MRIGSPLPWEGGVFDLILASYSLYFFAGILGEIRRVLACGGLFLSITHSEHSLRSLYDVAGVTPDRTSLLALLRNFSSENGEGKLRHYFRDVERVEYRNDLRFGPDQIEEALEYVRCKVPLLLPGRVGVDEVPWEWRRRLMERLAKQPCFVIEKDDTIFRCRGPR